MDSVLWRIMEHIANTDDRVGGYTGILERASMYTDCPVAGPTPFRCRNPLVVHQEVQVGDGEVKLAQPAPAPRAPPAK
eukprot:9323404-Alexandrium_andersonii.AAC.1